MVADTADAFASGQREAREADRVALVAALNLPPETTWADALARVVPVAVESTGAKGCHWCRFAVNGGVTCEVLYTAPGVLQWTDTHLQPDLLTPKPGAPECPGREPQPKATS